MSLWRKKYGKETEDSEAIKRGKRKMGVEKAWQGLLRDKIDGEKAQAIEVAHGGVAWRGKRERDRAG